PSGPEVVLNVTALPCAGWGCVEAAIFAPLTEAMLMLGAEVPLPAMAGAATARATMGIKSAMVRIRRLSFRGRGGLTRPPGQTRCRLRCRYRHPRPWIGHEIRAPEPQTRDRDNALERPLM